MGAYQVSDIMPGGFANRTSYTLGPGHFHCLARLPSCVTPVNTLAFLVQVPRSPPHAHPRRGKSRMVRAVSITRSAGAVLRRYGNINPLSIDYACRPRLRSRLTQGGLAWPWNPCSFGGRVSHPSFATHACILTRAHSTIRFLDGFTAVHDAPLPIQTKA